MTKEYLYELIEQQKECLFEMADQIHDNPEYDGKEHKAATLLKNYLAKNGFVVEFGLGEWPTAFRAVYRQGEGGIRIGLLCEYDALKRIGHGCGHHMQGPCICSVAVALKKANLNESFTLIVYGTPAEETRGAKINLLEHGYFRDIDVALMMHGGTDTYVDERSMAMSYYCVNFYGISSHASRTPEQGRSALDALLLAFNGVEYLREHVQDDVRMHYTISELPGAANVVPAHAFGEFSLRSYSRKVLDDVCIRFEKIIQGAAMMADVTYDIKKVKALDSKIPCNKLNKIIIDNAIACNAPGISHARNNTGSTDFGNVASRLPSSCIYVKFVPSSTPDHSQAFVDAGKSKEGHNAILYGAKILVGTCWNLISNFDIKKELWEDFEKAKCEGM